jgi:hypothetical protein
MREFIETPRELVINMYTVAFKDGDPEDEEFRPSEFALFLETAYMIIDPETGEEIYTEPIIHSLN